MNAITSQTRAGDSANRSVVTPVFVAANRYTKRFVILAGFSCWEHVQSAFQFGIRLPDATDANYIACARSEEGAKRAMTGRGFALVEGGAS